MEVLRRDWLPEDLRPLLEQQRINGCVAVQARADEAETDFLLMLATQYPWMAGVVGWVDLRADDLQQRISRWQDSPALVGFRHPLQDEPDVSMFVADARLRRGIRLLQQQQLAYDVLVYAHQIEAIVPLCASQDQHWLIIDHLGKPAIRDQDHSTWRRNLAALASMPHVLCKLSGLVTEALDAAGQLNTDHLRRYLDTALQLFSPQRLMFGSDWPVCLLAAPYARVAALIDSWAAPLSPDERAAIWGGTAKRAYSLD